MGPYKLAFVIERYFEFGGLQRDMRRFAAACAQRGHDVTVFTGRWDGPRDAALKVEIADFKSLTNHGTVKRIEAFVRGLRARGGFDCIVGFKRVSGLDVYFAGDVCLMAKLQRQRRYWLRFLPRYRSYLQQEASVFGPSCDAELLVISPAEAETIRRIYGTKPERIHILPPGIDRQRLISYTMTVDQRKEFRKQYGVDDDGFLILTIGSGFMTKGIDRAIKAIAALPEDLKARCQYIVVGKGDAKRFQRIAEKAGIGSQVTFTGGRSDISPFYRASDLLLHPARTEAAGHTLLEAMLFAVPVAVTEHCGYARYVREAEAGVLCPEPFEQVRLKTLLRDLLENRQMLQRYGQNGLHYTETADIYSMTDKAVETILARAAKNKATK